MIDPKLAQYVRQQQLSGMQKQDIVNELLSAGWTQEYIDEIF